MPVFMELGGWVGCLVFSSLLFFLQKEVVPIFKSFGECIRGGKMEGITGEGGEAGWVVGPLLLDTYAVPVKWV